MISISSRMSSNNTPTPPPKCPRDVSPEKRSINDSSFKANWVKILAHYISREVYTLKGINYITAKCLSDKILGELLTRSTGTQWAFYGAINGLFHFLFIQGYGRQFSKFTFGLEFQGLMPKMTHRKTIFHV